MARRHKWNALTYERGNDMDVELVDLAGVEERGDQPAATHHPDVFSRSGAQTLRKCLHRLRHEFHTWRRPLRRLPGEHVVGELRVEHHAFPALFSVIGETPIVGLASPQDGVDRRVKRGHAVIDRAWPAMEPIDIAVWPSDVAIRARRNVNDDLSLRFHGTISDSVSTSGGIVCYLVTLVCPTGLASLQDVMAMRDKFIGL